MKRLLIRQVGTGLPHLNETIVAIKTADGHVERLVISRRLIENSSIPVESALEETKNTILIEFPSEIVTGARRVWVNKDELVEVTKVDSDRHASEISSSRNVSDSSAKVEDCRPARGDPMQSDTNNLECVVPPVTDHVMSRRLRKTPTPKPWELILEKVGLESALARASVGTLAELFASKESNAIWYFLWEGHCSSYFDLQAAEELLRLPGKGMRLFLLQSYCKLLLETILEKIGFPTNDVFQPGFFDLARFVS
jgi:hypothetical protein